MATLDKGDTVQIIDGLYRGFRGAVENIDHQNERAEAAVAVYGRQTVLRLGPSRVERL
jgi:transcription antitermination factor NusG